MIDWKIAILLLFLIGIGLQEEVEELSYTQGRRLNYLNDILKML